MKNIKGIFFSRSKLEVLANNPDDKQNCTQDSPRDESDEDFNAATPSTPKKIATKLTSSISSAKTKLKPNAWNQLTE